MEVLGCELHFNSTTLASDSVISTQSGDVVSSRRVPSKSHGLSTQITTASEHLAEAQSQQSQALSIVSILQATVLILKAQRALPLILFVL